MDNFFAELKRRHIYRVAAAYAVVAWLLLQIVNNVVPIMQSPPWVGQFCLLLLALGFPVAIFLAWMRELPPSDAAAPMRATLTDWALIGILVAVLTAVGYQQLGPSRPTVTAQLSVEAARQAAAKPTGISIAVLPFANMSGDAGQEYFSDGMSEEITSALAKVPDLRVVGRTSAFQFKGQSKDLRAIGQSLSARYLIEGSVRKAGTQVRIAAQLVRADDGVQLWSESYDRELTNIFAIQEDIAQAIAGALQVPLGLQQGETLVSNRTNDLESYQQYLRGRALVRARAVNDAIDVLEPVVARDPGYAPAWAMLAGAYRLVPAFSPILRTGPLEEARLAVQSSLDKGEAAARKAIELDARFAGGYEILAFIQAQSGKWAAAEDLYRQALALDPNDPDVLHDFSRYLLFAGRLKDALTLRERLRSVEPFVPIYNIVTAEFMQVNGQSQASIPILEAIPADAAGGFYRNVFLARAYARAGRYGEGADTLLAITGNQVTRRSAQDAAQLLRGAPAKTTAPQQLPALQGELNFVYAYVGALDRIMEFSERSLELQSLTAVANRSLWLPEFAPLRKTARFKAFVRKAGLVEYWKARGWPALCHPTAADDFECN